VIERTCWCGSATAADVGVFALDDGKRFPIVQCTSCGVLTLFPQPSDAELMLYYSQEYYGSSRRKFIGPVAAVVGWFQGGRARMAAHHCPRGGRILDIGCGNGGFLIQMKRRGFVVEGTEWTAQSAARVPPEHNIPVHVGDLLALDVPNRSYDLVTLWHVFEHLRQPDKTLQKIRELLKPGGRLILSLPNAQSPQARRFGTAWLHHDPPRHLFGFGPHAIERLLSQQGFQIESLNTFSLEQNPFGYVQSWLNARGLPRDRLYSALKGFKRDPAGSAARDYLWLLVLGLPALLITTWESWRGCGATMTLVARSSR
jgi:SAM-dependent methyltransferase